MLGCRSRLEPRRYSRNAARSGRMNATTVSPASAATPAIIRKQAD
jgi:hypothetical protein